MATTIPFIDPHPYLRKYEELDRILAADAGHCSDCGRALCEGVFHWCEGEPSEWRMEGNLCV